MALLPLSKFLEVDILFFISLSEEVHFQGNRMIKVHCFLDQAVHKIINAVKIKNVEAQTRIDKRNIIRKKCFTGEHLR